MFMSAIRNHHGWWFNHSQVYALLGIQGSKLPAEGFQKTVSGIEFTCRPAAAAKPLRTGCGPRRPHRLFVQCDCGFLVPFGRMHQHIEGKHHQTHSPSAVAEREARDCTCYAVGVGGPDERVFRDRNCPVHGIDPDWAYEMWRERQAERR